MRLWIGSGFGIPIYVHWTFFLLPLWVVWSHPDDAQMSLGFMLTLLALTFASVVLHEFGHILMARRFGIDTQDVTLYPIGGVARLKRMSEKPVEEILIAVAGPAVNVVIAAVVFCLLVPAMLVDSDWVLNSFVGRLGIWLFITNAIFLLLFNLIPAFPMDGGRVLRALLSLWLGHYRATLIAVRISAFMAVLMGIVGVVTQSYMLAVVGIFIMIVGQSELLMARMRERQQQQRLQDEEPLTVLPAHRGWPSESASTGSQIPAFVLKPKVLVYTWDNRSGTWRQEPGALA